MTDYGSSSLMVGPGLGAFVSDAPPRRPDPRKEYVAAAPGWMSPAMLTALSPATEQLTRTLGPRVYQAMLTDPAVSSSYNSLRLAILAGGLSLAPSVKQPASARNGAVRTEPGSVRKLTPEQARSQEIAEFCERALSGLGESLTPLLFQLLDAMAYGCKLAEVTYKPMVAGVDKGKLGLASVKVKPNWAWRFVVDGTNEVKGILTWSAESGYVVLDPRKFVWHTWMPEDSDPRGTSALRAAYHAWNLKVQAWPQYYAHLVRFGSPSVDAEMAEGDNQPRQPIDSEGNEIADAEPVSAEDHFRAVLAFYRAGGTVVHPFGSKINLKEPTTNGEAFLNAFDLYDRQICLAIQYQARAALEAKNGSKADSETAKDEKGLIIWFGRESLCGVIRRLLRNLVADNFGDVDADLHTPTPSLGEAEHQDRPALWNAASALKRAGYLGDSQLEELDAALGLPVRDPEADAKAAAERAKLAPAPADTGKASGDESDSETPPGPAKKAGDGGKPGPEGKP